MDYRVNFIAVVCILAFISTFFAEEVTNITTVSVGEQNNNTDSPEELPPSLSVDNKTSWPESTYERLRPCLKNSKFAGSSNVNGWKYPADAEEHYDTLLEKTKIYRGHPAHHGPGGFKGPWIENIFIDYFIDKPLSFFNGLIPLFVQWTDIHVSSFDEPKNTKIPDFKQMLKHITEITRPDVIYLAVSQDDQGIFSQLASDRPNILSLSAGGFGHVPIPLIKGELNYSEPPQKFSWDVGFFGNVRPRLSRSRILDEMQRAAQSNGLSHKYAQSSDWEKDIANSKFNLAPRGFGRTSYRLAEIIQIGRVPVYLYDDSPWLPYEGTEISLSHYGFMGKMGQLGGLARTLKQTNEVTYKELLEKVAAVRVHYTYPGLIRQIEMFIKDPLGPSGGDLRCTRVPDKDHRLRGRKLSGGELRRMEIFQGRDQMKDMDESLVRRNGSQFRSRRRLSS